MKTCSKHIVPEYLQDLKKVSEDIADMPYDKVVEFLQHFEKKINKDADKDHERGNYRLSILLGMSGVITRDLKENFQKIWELCKPYM